VYICFDSDILSNGNVCAAAQGLADELERRGARVYLTILPQLEQGQKTGLDDFLVSDQADTMIEVLRLSSPIGIVDTLFDFSQRYLVVRDPGLIFDMQMGCRWSLSAFQESIENTKSYQERYLDKDGQVAWRMTAAGKAYVSWPLRTEVQKITYAPGQPAFVANSPVMYNQWPGWGCEPKKGSVAPFTALLDHLFTGAEPEARKWFLQWLAYPLQYPGTKLFSAAVIFGVVEGTGKSLVGYTMKRIYGKNFAEIGQDDLHSSDNDWAENVQFVLGEEITGSNSRQDADRLKKLITQLTVRINIKFIPKYSVPDCINYLFTSNQPTAVFLGDTDRRYFIHEVQVSPKPPAFYTKYLEWLNGDGPSALFDYLLHVDVSDFSPGAPAYKTAAKDRMTADNQSALGEWVRYLRDDPNEVLVIGGMASPYDLYSARELLSLYDAGATTKTTTNGLGREMKRAGFRQVLDGRPIKVPGRPQERYYVVRNADKWEKATGKQVLAHLSAVPEVKTPKY
jgi:hypothetical protein